MQRAEFDHAIRAAGAILGESEIIVIGSQAVHASLAEPLPEEAARSMEVDIASHDDDARKADLIDGSIGEASMFHRSFGFYAQGVEIATAVLAPGWRERLVRYETPATNGVVAWCLELHDLWVAKAIAGREKDRDFCEALCRQGSVDPVRLVQTLDAIEGLDSNRRDRVRSWIDQCRPE